MLDEHLYDLADRYGIMLMPGWCCCNFWEKTEEWTPEHYVVARESLRDQLRQLRNHASVFVFLYGSDTAPSLDAESMYLGVLAEENWPNPSLASATDNTTAVGRTGVKMRGPYAWVGPNYWLLDTDRGGAFGFATEIGPGHAIPVVESLRQMFPADHLWPPDEYWIYHEATPTYPNLDEYTAALGARYGTAKSLADYAMKSQVVAYEGERAMFEAYGRNKYTSTGVIQWMLNNAWPSIVWHLYDWYLRPGGGYFGAKKANEPLHVQYSYDDRSIVVVNSLYTAFRGYTVTAKVYNMDLTEKFSNTASIDIAEDSSTRVFVLPDIADLSRTYFVRLALYDPDGNRVSSNFYWLSTQPDVYDWNASNAWQTPVTTHADLSALESLPAAEVTVARTSEESGTDRVEHVRVRNPSSQLAFFLRLTVVKSTDGSDIAPVYWEDNFFELMPGEEREISARFLTKLLGGAASRIRVEGWNVSATSN
jgi:exo-1,4-beta-D-glucosaminidase